MFVSKVMLQFGVQLLKDSKDLVSFFVSKLINCSLCTILYCTAHLAHIICKCDTLHLFHFLFSPVFERDYHFLLFLYNLLETHLPLLVLCLQRPEYHVIYCTTQKSKLLCTNAFAFALNASLSSLVDVKGYILQICCQ